MTDLEATVQAIHNAMVSVVQESGYFKQVNDHEPTSPVAGLDMFAACWAQLLRPIAARSGLNTVSGLLVYNVRLYSSQMSEQQDYIDPQMIRATAKLMSGYCGGFTLGGRITAVDLLGLSGDIPLSAIAGYLQLATFKYRVMTLTVPMVVDDLFTQAA